MIDVVSLFARGGGGGSGGGGGGVGIIVLPFVIAAAIGAWWRRKQQIKKAKLALTEAVAKDPAWQGLAEHASAVFYQFQQDWCDMNLKSMKQYLAPRYFEHISLMLEALQQMNRQNRMSNLVLTSSIVYNVADHDKNTDDNFDIEMKATAVDELVDVSTDNLLFRDDSPFTEIWNFDREGDNWVLNAIYQTTSLTAIEKGYTSKPDEWLADDEEARMRAFAQRNDFFYNADFGWLLMPNRGELFTLANFGRSDINYHVLGKYHDVLVQFYQYVPVTEDKRHMGDYLRSVYKEAFRYDSYIIAQTILPKSYGNIIVKRKGTFGIGFNPRGTTKISLEGVDFNKYYSVYASDAEKVTSLELLHPRYMEILLDLPFVVNLEIVGNVLYLYSTDKKADFDTMLALLHNAFEEMKM